ncbi:CGCGG family putative rSAM-modified RiPP protein [Halorubrum pallidum]|uniref:CGCGG family rSAM-modified RiPP protein n=1 Tax=Halorubrum pallidum TaxID=1526114 RepID=A0ABD5T1S5_9EURY
MTDTHDTDHDTTAEPITDRVHDNSWSANLEAPRYADDRELVVRDALAAIDHTAPGNHVNLVTHGDLGHPSDYLYDAIDRERGLEPEYVERCGCGGHVSRVQVE